MKKEILESRAPMYQTQDAILKLLESGRPMQRWEIAERLNLKPDQSLKALVKRGLVEQYEDTNEHPKGDRSRTMATYFAFVTRAGQRKTPGPGEYSERTVTWCIKVLRQMGYTVEKPNAEVTGPERRR